MKITELKTHLYEFENNRVVGDANSPAGRKLQSNLLIEVKTDEGLTGYSSAGAAAKPLVESMFNRALKDKDPSNVKGITKQMMYAILLSLLLENLFGMHGDVRSMEN